MDGSILALFVLAAFVGGFVSGFSGFAMGLVVSGVWLHIITPVETAILIAGYGLLTQSYGILKLRHALRWQNVWPLTLGSAIGIPIGVVLLTYVNPTSVRFGVGVVIILISMAIAGAVTAEALRLYAIGLPFLLTGLWAGFKLYGKIDDEAFRRAVLVLLLLSGLSLIVPVAILHGPSAT